MTQPKNSIPTAGIACGVGAAMIWGAWPVVTAIGVHDETMTPFHLVLVRFAVAGPLLLPFAFRGNPGLKEWGQAFIFMLGAGFAYSMVVSTAFLYAPASHGGVIIPGTMMVTSLVAAHFLLDEKMTPHRTASVAVILLGLVLLAVGDGAGAMTGDLLFVAGGLMWASYAFLLRRWPTDSLALAARISILSLVCAGVGAALGYADGIVAVTAKTLATQGLWQGVLSAIVALVLFSKAVGHLGSGRASTLNALIPVIAVSLSFLILGEKPGVIEWLGLLGVIMGIAGAMGVRPIKQPSKARNKGRINACSGMTAGH